ncbi:hypothetical protein LINPERHAP2_LOCUS20107, partial [Linum perenne]
IKRGDFWQITSKVGSWHWRRLLKLRSLIRPFISVDSDVCVDRVPY